MKSISQDYKNAIKEFGREIDAKITYTLNNQAIELGSDDINSISLHYEGDLLKSIMKQLDIDSNVEIPIGTDLTCQFGVNVNGTYEYINYGHFIVKNIEQQQDLYSYKITCYDKLLYSMKDYENMSITYPITVRNYLSAICTHLGLTFANSSDAFTNYDKQITRELYLDENGNSLNYTFRDVLDELSQVTASNICINNDDELEVRYVNELKTANILNPNKFNSTTYIPNYDATTSIMTKLTSTGGWPVIFDNLALEAGYYTIYCEILEGTYNGGNICFYDLSGNKIGGEFPFRNSTTHIYVLNATNGLKKMSIYQPTSTTDCKIKIWMAKGNYTVSTMPVYEPYGLDQVDEEYFKDVNVNTAELYGPINTITFKRSADSDVISVSNPTDLQDNLKKEIVISDNQILNESNRGDYIDGILTQLYGLQYYTNDFASTGITYYELCDKYNVSINGVTYDCLMLNDEINITQGLEENIHTEIPQEAKTDYTKTSKDDRTMLRTELIVNKQEGKITGLVASQDSLAQRLYSAEVELDDQGARLDIATQHIDPVTGDILELKRTNYEFGANGIIIDDEQGYKSVKNTTGDYYYENDTMIGKYTKDGSVQKDIALFGKYYYGIDENLDVQNFTKDDAMFVAQLYEDGNGEDCFGHFFNGGGN